MKEEIVLIGRGGHARVVIDSIKKSDIFHIRAIIDKRENLKNEFMGIPIIIGDEKLPLIFNEGVKTAFIAIGSVGDCNIRIRIDRILKKIGFKLAQIVHPSAVIAEQTSIKEGAFVSAGAIIGPCVKLGRNSIINTSSSIDHNCIINDFVHIAPGVTLSGDVEIGKNTHIGTGAIIVNGIKIGKNNFIKAGTLVYKDMPDK